MTKLSKKKLDSEDFSHYVNNLWSAFTLMDTKEDIRQLFKDLFTHTEYKMFAKRLEIARRLLSKERYDDIISALNVTARTITVVSNNLSEKGDGLRKAHKKLSDIEDRYRERDKEARDNMSNPFRQKARSKTVAGQLIKAGLHHIDRKISQTIKRRSARKDLQV